MNAQTTALTTAPARAGANGALVAGLQPAAELGQYLTFMLGNEIFAISILSIKEIIEYDTLTVVPMMPAAVRGVINLRGSVVPVMDLSARFGKPSSTVTKRTCIVIVEVNDEESRHDVGVIVDMVNEVLDISASEIEPPPAFGARIRNDFILGMGKVAGRFVILLDVDHVFAFEDLASLTESAPSAPN